MGRDRPSGGPNRSSGSGADGTAIVNADDPVVARVRRRAPRADVIDVRSRIRTPTCGPRTSSCGPDATGDPSPRLGRRTRAGGARRPGRAHGVERPRRRRGRPVGRRHARRMRDGAQGAGVTRWRMETFTGSPGIVRRERRVQREPRVDGGRAEVGALDGRGGRLIAVLGHMAELGPVSFEEHERLGELVVTDRRRAADRRRAQARTIARAGDPRGRSAGGRRVATTSRRRPRPTSAQSARPGDVVLVRRGPGSRVSNAWRRPFDDATTATRCVREVRS